MDYPKPNRSGYIPQFATSKNNNAIDLSYGETKLSDGRIIRGEVYSLNQLTMCSYFFSTLEIENYTIEEVRDFLVKEFIIDFSDEVNARLCCEKIYDSANNQLWEAKVIVSDEDKVFVKSCSKFNFQSYIKPTEEINIFEDMSIENFELVLNSLPTSLKLGLFEIKDQSLLYDTTKEIKVWEDYKESVLNFLEMFYSPDYSPYTKEDLARILFESYITDEEDHYLDEDDLIKKYSVEVKSLHHKSIARLEKLWSLYKTTWNAEDENKSMFITALATNYFVDIEGITKLNLLFNECFY